jgi:hypothetical protein
VVSAAGNKKSHQTNIICDGNSEGLFNEKECKTSFHDRNETNTG